MRLTCGSMALCCGALLVACDDDGSSATESEPPAADSGSPSPEPDAHGVIQSGTRIVLPDGEIEGATEEGVRRFFGIPYAAPPIGERRFAAPEKIARWNRVLDATAMGGRCAQPDSLTSGAGTDNEDCLTLNVWTPSPAPEAPLPVLVWIHGGGNATGSTADLVPIAGERLFYDGHAFAAHHGVVVVSMNYRLGVFGYLAHQALTDDGAPSGNAGLFDQRMALEWVRDNVAAFGGDPDNVTIFGESAGARNVCFHVVSPGSRGLFHRAVSQSGDCTAWHWPSRAEAEAEAEAFVDFVGCGDASDVLSCLRALPSTALLVDPPLVGAMLDPAPGGERYSGGSPAWDFGPVVDGDFVPDVPRSLFSRGDVARVPYLMGTNTDEGNLAHLTADTVDTEAAFLQALDLAFGAFAPDLAAIYPVSDFPTPNDAIVRVTTDSRYACAVQDFSDRATDAGLEVYAYNFDMPYAIPSLESLGKAHAAEIPFVFKSLAPDWWPAGAEPVADLVQGYWSRFAATGDPNGGDAPEWPALTAERGNRLNLSTEPSVVESFRAERCAVWKRVFAAQ
jgi:para-nitrobenzyl esterase